jgi:hypothetical protein
LLSTAPRDVREVARLITVAENDRPAFGLEEGLRRTLSASSAVENSEMAPE